LTNYQTIPEYKLHPPSECIDIADVLGLDWVFRGQQDADWGIASSLEREVRRFRNTSPQEFEAHALQQIKLATTYPEGLQMAGSDDFSWLSFLQHHGCKTRLVDFTESFYVALFFALRDLPAECGEDTDQNAVVWAIKRSRLDIRISTLAEQLGWDGSANEMAHRLVNNAIELHWRYEESNDPALAIAACKPARINQRLIAQQGLFLAPLNLKHSFMKNLSKCLCLQEGSIGAEEYKTTDELKAAKRDLSAMKIIIPASQHRTLLFHLKRMNITEATLFPGLDGFARSLNYYAVGMELAP